MPIRKSHKKGQWLVEDTITGFVKYSGQVTTDYLGAYRDSRDVDYRNPQDFVHSVDDSSDVAFMTGYHEGPEADVCLPTVVGSTNVATDTDNAANHIYDLGIGDMKIGYNFCVR